MGSYTDNEIEIMIALADNPSETEKDLRRLLKRKSSINSILRKMEKRGLIEKEKGMIKNKRTVFYSATSLTNKKVRKWARQG